MVDDHPNDLYYKWVNCHLLMVITMVNDAESDEKDDG